MKRDTGTLLLVFAVSLGSIFLGVAVDLLTRNPRGYGAFIALGFSLVFGSLIVAIRSQR